MPVAKIRTPDGRIGRFNVPEGTTPEQVLEFANKQFAQVQPEPAPTAQPDTLGGRIKADLQAREAKLQTSIVAEQAGEQTKFETKLQQTGQGAGAVLDVAGELLLATPVVGDALELAGEAIGTVAGGAAKLPTNLPEGLPQNLGEIASLAGDELVQFAAEHPRLARNAEAFFNIGVLVSPIKKKPVTNQQKLLTLDKAAKKSRTAGFKQEAQKRRDFARDLVIDEKKAVIENRAKDVGVRGFRSRTFEPSNFEKRIAGELDRLPAIKTSQTINNNKTIAFDEAINTSKKLQKRLNKSKVTFRKADIKSEINKMRASLTDDPFLSKISGEGVIASSEKILLEFEKIIDDIPAGEAKVGKLFRSRIEFDTNIERRHPNIFSNPERATAAKEATKAVREMVNKKVIQLEPNKEIQKSLSKSHHLFSAAEAMTPRALKEAETSIRRVVESVSKKVPLKAEIAGIGAGVGLSALGIPIGTAAGTIGIVVGGISIGNKVLKSAEAKKFLANILDEIDGNLKKGVTVGEALKQLRTDRAVILDLIEGLPEEEQQNENE